MSKIQALCSGRSLFRLLAIATMVSACGPGRAQDKEKTPEPTAKKSLGQRIEMGTVLAGSEDFDVGERGKLTITITEKTGNKVKASYVYTNKDQKRSHRDLEGEIEQNRITFKSTGEATQVNISLGMSGDELKGSVSHSTLGKGKIGLKFPK